MRQALDHLHTVCEVIESGGGGPNLPSWIVGHRGPDFVLVVLGTVIAVPVGTYLRQGMMALRRIWQARPFGLATWLTRILETVIAGVIVGVVLLLIFGN